MSARDCRLVADLLPDLRALIDQPSNDPSQLAFPMSDIARAASNAQDEVFRLASQLDADWTTTSALVSVTAGALYVVLPANLRAIRSTCLWNSTNNTKIMDLACGEWSQDGVRPYDCLFKPKDHDYSNQATLRFLKPFPRTGTIKVVYDYFPVRLMHGCLPVAAGSLSMMLADYEPLESGLLVGQTAYIVKDPAGTGAGQSRVCTGWDGPTRSFSVSVSTPWNPSPRAGAEYTSRPDIPRDWERLYTFEMAVQLGLKLPERIVETWAAERERLEVRAKHQGITMDRRAAKIVRVRTGAPLMIGGDPINGPTGW